MFEVGIRKIGGFVAISCVWAGLVASAHGATAAGTTPATLSVSNTGAANYVVPIQVPPGVAGMQPNLSLKYDSQGPRDIAGPGWALNGVPYIRRCAKTLAQDGIRGGISLNSEDRFCYQGMRLVMPSGQSRTYGADQAVYRTEIDTFSRVTSYGTTGAGSTAGNGPTYFVVEEKGGRKLYFGQTTNSRLVPGRAVATDAAPTTVLVWYLNQIVDRNGNAIDFSYTTSAAVGEVLLDQISYAGGKARVQFGYISDLNPRTAYVAGAQTNHSMLLKSITTSVYANGSDAAGSGKVAKSYTLAYDFFDAKGATLADQPIGRLSSITECSTNRPTPLLPLCLSPLKFQWNYWSNNSNDHLYGLPMTIGSGANGALNFTSGNGFSAEGALNMRRFADINGDGRPDLIAFWDNQIYAYLSNGVTGFNDVPTPVGTGFGAAMGFGAYSSNERYIPDGPIYLVDMNRDGYPDVLGFDESDLAKQTAYIAYFNPATGKFGLPQKVRSTPIGFYCAPDYLNDELSNPRFLADMNADGYPDIVRLTTNGAVVSYFDPMTGIDGGTGIFSADVSVAPALYGTSGTSICGAPSYRSNHPTSLVDLNGDGYPDLIVMSSAGTRVLFWQPEQKKFSDTPLIVSTSFSCCNGNTAAWPIYFMDMNGDGYPDVVQMKSDGLYVYLWTGATLLPASKWTSQLSGGDWVSHADLNPRQLVDVNGDGFPDLIGFSSLGIQVALSNGNGGFADATVWDSQEFRNGAVGFGNNFGRASITPRFLQDISGAGTPDAIGFGDKSLIWARLAKAPGQYLHVITDGLGRRTQINYEVAQPFTGIYYPPASASFFPLRDVAGPYYVVSAIASDDGVGGERRKTYQYGSNRADFYRGPLGFEKIISTDDKINTTVQQMFYQQYPIIGYLSRVETSVDSTVTRVSDTYLSERMDSTGEYAGNSRYFNFLRNRTEQKYDGKLLWSKSTNNFFAKTGATPMQWGDLTSSVVTFSDGNSSTKTLVYLDVDEPNWLLGRVQQITETVKRPGQTIAVTPPADAPQTVPSTPAKLSSSALSALMSVINSLLLDD